MERLKAAQIELTNALKNMEHIRQQIRNSGDVEPDSLLCLCDKEDNYILSYIMNYLDVDDLGRCELVCNTLNKQAKKVIDKLDGVHIMNYTGKGEPVPKDVTFVGFHPCVVEISKEAFKDCIKLRQVVLNEGLVSIRKDAFCNCTSLTSIKFPSTLIEIADSAFNGCCNLEKAILNDGLHKLGDKAFSKCTSLESIILPPTLTLLGYYVFGDCTSLTDVVFNEERKGRKIGRLEVLEDLKNQYERQKYDDYDDERVSHSNLKEVVFHTRGLIRIEKGLFCGCKSLERIKLPSTILTIEKRAFYECFRLREFVLNEGVWGKIGDEAFYACESLKSLTLPSSIQEIGYEVFAWCTNLREVILNEGMKKIKDGYFGYRWSSLDEIDSKFYKKVRNNAFAGCRSLECIKFPYIAARLEYIIQAGHDIETKIEEFRGVFEWRGNELLLSAAETKMRSNFIAGPKWKSVEECLNKIVNLLAFYEFKEATILFELALWKAKIDQTEGANPVDRAACRTEVPRRVKETILKFMFRGYGN